MNIKLKTDNPKQTELVKAMGAYDVDASKEAMKIFARLVGQIAQTVLDETNDIVSFYDPLQVGEFEPRTIALDDYHDLEDPDYVRVSFSSKPGDLASSLITGSDEFPINFYDTQAAISYMKKYLRAGQLNHAEKGIAKLLNEVMFKNKFQAIQPILESIAGVQTNDKYHVIRSETANQLVIKDFNRLKTLAARIVTSGLGGTPQGQRGVSDLLMSPEMVEEIRGFAYQPMNTRGAPNSDESTAIPAPDQVRSEVFNNGGIPSIYGTNIIEMNELGVDQAFNTIFDNAAGATAYEGHGGTGTSQFDGSSEELIIGINRQSQFANGLVKAELVEEESTFNVRPDTQFLDREDKIGMWGKQSLSFMSVEPRTLFGLIV